MLPKRRTTGKATAGSLGNKGKGDVAAGMTRSSRGIEKPHCGPTAAAPMISSPTGKRGRDGATASERRAPKKAKVVSERRGEKQEAVPPRKRRKPTGKTPRPGTRAAAEPLPAINEAPTKALRVFVFGNGENGDLGLGAKRKSALRPRQNPFLDPDDDTAFHIVQLDCGGMHTVALTRDHKVVTWGVNDDGALGRDTSWDGGLRDVDAESGSDDDEELNPLESTPAEVPQSSFPSGTKIVQVAAGDNCTLGLTDTGLVYGWGTFIDAKGDKRFGYDSTGNTIKIQKTPMLIAGVENITQIACGANHALALDIQGRVWGWGVGEKNQLGRRPFGRHQETHIPRQVRIGRSPVRYIASGEHHSFAVDANGDVWGWGLNNFGQAGYAKDAGNDETALPYPMKIPDLCGKGVIVLDGGNHHSAAVTSEGQCFTWGRIDGGQLGIEFSSQLLEDATLVRYDEYNKPRICLRPAPVAVGHAIYVGCGTDHTIFVNADRKAFATGFNSVGQLGTGSEDDEDVAKEIGGRTLKDKELVWAGAGGQFSAISAVA